MDFNNAHEYKTLDAKIMPDGDDLMMTLRFEGCFSEVSAFRDSGLGNSRVVSTSRALVRWPLRAAAGPLRSRPPAAAGRRRADPGARR